MRPSIPRKDDWFSGSAAKGWRDGTSAIVLQQRIGEEDQGVWTIIDKGVSHLDEYGTIVDQ
jgi:hypothetical protein